MFILESDKMASLCQNDKLTFTFHSQIAYKVEQLVEKKFLDSMIGLQNDEMTAL